MFAHEVLHNCPGCMSIGAGVGEGMGEGSGGGEVGKAKAKGTGKVKGKVSNRNGSGAADEGDVMVID